MDILCGIDFSASSKEALQVAADFAKASKNRIQLVHIVDELGAVSTMASPQNTVYDPLRAELHVQAEAIRQKGIDVEECFLSGLPDEMLSQLAANPKIKLMVLSSVGHRAPHRWLLGSTTERTAITSPAPLLVVRSSQAFEEWFSGQRPLKVMVAAEVSKSSLAAMQWAQELSYLGPCEVTIAHFAWPPVANVRHGIRSDWNAEEFHPDAVQAIQQELQARLGKFAEHCTIKFAIQPALDRIPQHLAALAEEHQIDLVVVGTHQRTGLSRLWHGSVSAGVLHSASMNVACIPVALAVESKVKKPQRIVAATDFSEIGNRAIAHAYSVCKTPGEIHLLYIDTDPGVSELPNPLYAHYGAARNLTIPQVEERKVRNLRQLQSLDASFEKEAGLESCIAVLFGRDAAHEIVAYAERVAADMICVGSHGRSGFAAALLGSVTRKILACAPVPVLVAPPS